jgi:hypothetical protein
MVERRNRRPRHRARIAALGLLVVASLGLGAIWTNAFGVGDRYDHVLDRIQLAIDPPPNRPTRRTVVITPAPSLATPAERTSEPPASGPPSESAGPETARPTPSSSPTPSAQPVREPVDLQIVANPESVFAHELTKEWCAPAGVQMVLTILGHGDTSERFQNELVSRIGEWESWEDSHNGGWGPAAMVEALDAYGAQGYEIRAYDSRADALRGSAAALTQTGAPVILIAWRGAHTWVMTGYRADADPSIFPDGTVSGTYVLDPWYPWVSSIWGPSDPPATFQDAAEMERNFLPWKRPEGLYPDRDSRFIVLVPTIPVPSHR